MSVAEPIAEYVAEYAGAPIPVEADWDLAPDLIDGAQQLELTPAGCNLDYWLRAVAQGTLRGLVGGHRRGAARRSPTTCGAPARCARH